MKKTVVLIYKNWHTHAKNKIRYFDKFEDAENEAYKMIEQFKFWGGGSVPVAAVETIWKKSNGCKELSRAEYSESLYIRYARENGTLYGYYKATHPNEKAIKIA